MKSMSREKTKAVVLLSSGLDSLVNLAWAAGHYRVSEALTFDYGQRAAEQEIRSSRLAAEHYGIPHRVIAVPQLRAWTRTALVDTRKPLPRMTEKKLDHKETANRSAQRVWVPNRNGIFINLAAARAESLQAAYIVAGFNREEGRTFPDNSLSFVKAANACLRYSTLNHVKVTGKTLALTKPEIVRLGVKLKTPFQFLWSCYRQGPVMCGVCESCLRLKRAAKQSAPELLEVFKFAR